jgi:sodium transport system ATP-binding protein
MIYIEDLRKFFGRVPAVDGISFTARDACITGLVGPNGSGKTTTLRMMTGLARQDSGRILVDGVSPVAEPIAARSRIGALTDSLGNYPRLTAREHLRYFGELRGMPAAQLESRIDDLIDRFDMRGIADRRAQGFSQGERMKVALARAIVHDPPNVLLDEPGNGLDVLSARTLRNLLAALRAAGKCVILSSHVMAEIAALCDRVVIVSRGRVVGEGAPEELLCRTGASNLEEAFVALTV